ncbi:MAG: AsmA family protein [Planctomycetota bacterium]|jgi:hypothetical protein
MKAQIEQYVHEKYQADINIGSLQFEVWDGHALLTDIVLQRSEPDQDIKAAIESIELDCQLIPLVFRNVNVNQLILTQPVIEILIDKQDPDVVDTTDTTQAHPHPFLESVSQIVEICTGRLDSNIQIKELKILDGIIAYRLTKADSQPFEVQLNQLHYSANNINARWPFDFVLNADIASNILLGDTEAELRHQFSQKPYSSSLNNVNLGYLSQFSKQKDALQIQSGTAGTHFLVVEKLVQAKIDLRDIKLKQPTAAGDQTIAFIPVENILNYVNQTEGNLLFELKVDKMNVHTSQDLEYFTLELWEGLWKQFVREVTEGKLKELKEAGTQKLLNFFNKDKEDTSEE